MQRSRRRAARAASGTLLLACALALTGCSLVGGDPGPVETSAAATVVPVEEPATAPLRGTPVAAGTTSGPSLAAKIDNHEDARPQLGLERADIVFEELVEGGLTRYVAVWQSDVPDLIGPVRSIRPMDPDIISPLGGIVAYSGGQEQFVEMMRDTPVFNAVHGDDGTDDTFFRADDRESPHDVMARAAELVAEHRGLEAPTQQFDYSTGAADSTAGVAGTPTSSLDLVFSDARFPSWSWDETAGAFLRSQEGSPDFDAQQAQLAATNVVTLRVDEVYDYDAEVPRAVLVASGEAWVSTGGRTVHATWSKDAAASPIRLADDQGAAVLLAPGATWVELVPLSGDVTVVAPSA
ncbi:DUF3048 domain-containing protein [Herbiconiux sp. P18]|uniref:DUF3048 domain-containing protein n=1 Tax=Herbiconiux liangxiaofengii TaxID=3342795 RepID=UPI0035B723F3